MAADLIPPVPDDQSLNFIIRNWLFKMRSNVNQFVIDISTLVSELATAISPTNPLTSSNISTYVNTQTISNTYVVDGTLTGTKIASATITDSNIANTTITGSKLVNGTITGTQIANTTISDSNIVSATITGAKIANSTITDANISSLNADKITAGAIRGININASSHTTVGSYLTSAPSGGATTVNVKDTTDFPSSGTAVVFDTTNDKDQFTYTGKTATTLTGCSGVLAHTNGATIIPLAESMTIDKMTNEMRFYGDRGDGTVEEMASIGITNYGSDSTVAVFGSAAIAGTRWGVVGLTATGAALYGVASTSGVGVDGRSNSGTGVFGTSSSSSGGLFTSTTGIPLFVGANTTNGNIGLTILSGRPTNRYAGYLAMMYTTGGSTDARTGTPRLMYADGTDWRKVSDDTIWTG